MRVRRLLEWGPVRLLCVISAVLNGIAILGFIVALVRIHNTTISGALLALVLCVTYPILPAWYIARTLHKYSVPNNRLFGIVLTALCFVSGMGIVIAGTVVLGVVGAHESDFAGGLLLLAVGLVGVFTFLPLWYFFGLLFGGNTPMRST